MESETKKTRIDKIENRLDYLESIAHIPVNWEVKIKSLEEAFERLYNLIKIKIKD